MVPEAVGRMAKFVIWLPRNVLPSTLRTAYAAIFRVSRRVCVRIRKIDTLEREGELIDGVMQSWVEAAADGWEKALRRALGGPDELDMSVEAPSQLAFDAAKLWAASPDPEETAAPPVEARPAFTPLTPEEEPIPVPALFGGHMLAGNGHAAHVAGSPNGDAHVDSTMAHQASPAQAPVGHHPAISHHRRSKPRRRPNKRWKKRAKARHRR